MDKKEGLMEIRPGTLSLGPILLKVTNGAISSLSLPPLRPAPGERGLQISSLKVAFLDGLGFPEPVATVTTAIWGGRDTESWVRQKAGKLGASLGSSFLLHFIFKNPLCKDIWCLSF